MNADVHQKKVEAIYDLRAAVETKVRAEGALDRASTNDAKDAYLDAIVLVEEKTQDAIDACSECGHPHPEHEDYRSRVSQTTGNVIDVDFRPQHDRENAG